MPTNDERREVAAEMRARANEIYLITDYTVGNQVGIDPDDFDDSIDAHVAIWNRLADLIEPEPQTCETCPQIDNRDSFIFHLLQAERHERTCRFIPENIHWYFDENDNEIETEEGHPDGSMECSCSQCGYPMLSDEDGWFDEEKGPHGGIIYKPRFNYCPNCGCRVKED